MLGDGELPSYEEPPCQECSPVPDYCSTGQTVLDPCGCCEECAKGEGDECGGLFGLYGTCADDLECVDNSEDPENLPGVCERTLVWLIRCFSSGYSEPLLLCHSAPLSALSMRSAETHQGCVLLMTCPDTSCLCICQRSPLRCGAGTRRSSCGMDHRCPSC